MEKKQNVVCGYKKFAFYIKEESRIVGVLLAMTLYKEVFIDELCVDEFFRGKGYGGALVRHLEEYLKGTAYENITLCTSEFQAPEFYKKLDFEVEFIRKNKNPKMNKYFFNKWINVGE